MGGSQHQGAGSTVWVLAGLGVVAASTIVDLATPDRTVLVGVLIAGPLLAAFGASTVGTATVSVVALAAAVALGAWADELQARDYTLRASAVAIGGVTAVLLSRARVARDRELARTRPGALEAQRLRIALDASEMGTWTWNRDTGEVAWDHQLEMLFGLEPGTFGGTFDAWVAKLHPDDREMVLTAVDDAAARVVPFRFDHRVVWPDSSIHWLEGRGEPVVDTSGRVVGAAGVAIAIDARRAIEAERVALLDAERAARARAEMSSLALQRLTELTLALSVAATVDEVAEALVHHGIEALGARYGWFALVDERTGHLVTRAHEGYPPEMIKPYLSVPLDTPLPGTEAVRSRDAIFIESPEDRRARYPQFPETGVHGSLFVVPRTPFEDVRGALAFGYPDARSFSQEDRRYISAVVEACAQALRRAVLLDAEQTTRARLRTLLDLSEKLAEIDDPDAVLVTTARFAAQRIGRYASVYVAEPEGLRRVAWAHADRASEPLLEELMARGVDSLELVERVAATGEPLLLDEMPSATASIAREDAGARERVAATGEPLLLDEMPSATASIAREDAGARELVARLHPTAAVVVPMQVAGRTRGVLVIGDDRPGALTASHLELAADIARRAASAHERTMLYVASQEQLEAEQRMVELLQASILPEKLPQVDGAQLAAVYRPAGLVADVGGDWYDAFVHDGTVILVVGDVAGHGVDAAAVMGQVRNALRAYAAEDDDPGALLRRIDRLLRSFEPHAMVTAAVARYDPRTREVTWSRAGHPPPLLCDGSGRIRYLDEVNATPLGTLSRGFASARARLGPGSLLVLYTDGLIERRDCVIDEGIAWLSERVRAGHNEPLEIFCNSLADQPFVDQPYHDDLCVLALRAVVP